MPIGTISRGRKKVAEGKWIPVKKGTKKPILTYSLKSSVKKAEDSIVDLDYERCFIFDATGKILLSKNGSEDRIEFTGGEMVKFKGAEVLTHNHPGSESFSPEDIQMAWICGFREMRVVGPKYDYSVKIAGKWSLETWNKFVDKLDEVDKEVRDYILPKLYAKAIPMEEANVMHWHRVWTFMAKQVDSFKYSRRVKK